MLRVGRTVSPRNGPHMKLTMVSIQRAGYSSITDHATNPTSQWRPSSTLDEWVERPVRPVSLRQLFFFGRTLTETRLINAANYVRTELPTRLAHRLREMQKLPYAVVTNPHLSRVYDLYYKAFETFRRVPNIRTLKDNDEFCKIVNGTLKEHMVVIPNLIMGVLECQQLTTPGVLDKFANTMLRARISRRVIAEQHVALTESFNSPDHTSRTRSENEFVGEILLKCNAEEILRATGKATQDLCRKDGGSDAVVPEINIRGHLNATFPYVIGHLEYIMGELLRNSIQAVMAKHGGSDQVPPINVLICEAQHQVIIRISDQGGGIPQDLLPHLWSFNKGPRIASRLENFNRVPELAGTVQEVQASSDPGNLRSPDSSLTTLMTRPPQLRLGMGLPMSRIYADYWAGGLELHSLEGYGCDAFLQISKIGNQNEQVYSRASYDAI